MAGLAAFFFGQVATQARKKLSDLGFGDASQRTITLTLIVPTRAVFGDAPAQGVVAVLGDALRSVGANQAVVGVVLVAGDDLAGFAAFFFDQTVDEAF
ncbi:hypothetical protein [Methylomonas koyamae]|uniref:hypothetical protein n=1 Tax=Methylomonas koyamae TaxID=702114 RepID=UPI003B01992B